MNRLLMVQGLAPASRLVVQGLAPASWPRSCLARVPSGPRPWRQTFSWPWATSLEAWAMSLEPSLMNYSVIYYRHYVSKKSKSRNYKCLNFQVSEIANSNIPTFHFLQFQVSSIHNLKLCKIFRFPAFEMVKCPNSKFPKHKFRNALGIF